MKRTIQYLAALILTSFNLCTKAQSGSVTVHLGSATILNTSTSYPAPYGNWYSGARHQMLVKASELTAQGLMSGNITSVAFDVTALAPAALLGFSMAMDTTSDTSLTTTFHSFMIPVFYDSSFSPALGWNTHQFSTPFWWNGFSNLIIETCFWNNPVSYTNNCVFAQTSNPFNATLYYYGDPSSPCGNITGGISAMRPDMQIVGAGSCSSSFSVMPDTTPHVWWGLNSATGTAPLTYSWNWGDGSATSSGPTPSHTYAAAGYFNICLSIADALGCTSTHCDSSTYIYRLGSVPITVNIVTSLPTGIQPQIINPLKIYPDPATDYLTIEGLAADQQLSFFDFTGRKIADVNSNGKTDISYFPVCFLIRLPDQGIKKVIRIQ